MSTLRKIINPEKLKEFSKKNLVHAHGVFDVFHIGHLLKHLQVKQNGDLLVVSPLIDVNKGP